METQVSNNILYVAIDQLLSPSTKNTHNFRVWKLVKFWPNKYHQNHGHKMADSNRKKVYCGHFEIQDGHLPLVKLPKDYRNDIYQSPASTQEV